MMKNFKIPLHIIAVSGIVINVEKKILMVNSNNYGWVFPGGQVEEEENLVNALKREVFEETGIKISVGEVFCISSNTKKHKGYNGVKEIPTKIILDFICRDVGGQIRTSDENSKSRYVDKNEITKFISNLALLERFKAYLNYSDHNERPTYLDYESRPNFKLKYQTLF